MASSREPKGDFLHNADPKNKDRGEREPLYSTRTGHMERTMFVVDLSRLKAEGDTLENALVLYRPEANIKLQQCEQRCSQLVGMALCTMNFTGNYPEYLRLKGSGYAIRALGDHYLMGLSSRIDEPPTSVVNHLKNVHDFFLFYYHSPANVMKSCQNDWEIFNRSMSQIFQYILRYLAHEQHSVPTMLNPLPYLNTQHCGKSGPRLFLLASRLLKACQQHESIVAGCIIHNSKILTSQFEPMLTEKLSLVGGGGVELNRLSILEDDIAPNKVWVLEVFLTPDEVESASNSRKDHIAFQATYASLDTNPHLTTSTLNMRFQVHSNRSGVGGPSSGVEGGGRGGGGGKSESPSTTRSRPRRGNWRNRTTASRSSRHGESDNSPSQIRPSNTTPDLAGISSSKDGGTTNRDPVATSTPIQRKSSEENIKIDMAQGSVTYSPSTSCKEEPNNDRTPTTSEGTDGPPSPPATVTASRKQEPEVYLDAMEEFDPTLLPPVKPAPLTAINTATSTSTTIVDRPVSSPSGGKPSRPTSTSSEGFSTPPPTPQDSKISMTIPFKPSEGLGAVCELSSASFMMASDSPLDRGGQDEQDGGKDGSEDGGEDKSDTLTRDTQGDTVDRGLADLNDEEIEKIVNAPIEISIDKSRRPISIVSGGALRRKVPSYPDEMRSWQFKREPVTDSDDESDFVSSTELQELIQESKELSASDLPPVTHRSAAASRLIVIPPPLPPRNSPKMSAKIGSNQRGEPFNQEGEDLPPPPRPPKFQQEQKRPDSPDYEDIDELTDENNPTITTDNRDSVNTAAHAVTVPNGLPKSENTEQHSQTTDKAVIPNGTLSSSEDEKSLTSKEDRTEMAESEDQKTSPKVEKTSETDASETTPVVQNGSPSKDVESCDPSKEEDGAQAKHITETESNGEVSLPSETGKGTSPDSGSQSDKENSAQEKEKKQYR